MDSGFYAAYSGLLARTEALDSAASNLANSNTTGFRAEREYFKAAIAGSESLESQLGTRLNSFGVLGGNQLDLGQGQLSFTGNVSDIGLQGPGFFAVMGSDGIRYTRDGSLRRMSDGTLATQANEPILGRSGKPVVLPAGEMAVGDDGAVSVNGAVSGQIGVFNLSPRQLCPEGTGKYRNLGPSPALATGTTLRQQYLESSNQDAIQGSMQLLVVQRQAEMMQKALTVFQNGFDKTATEDLPKS